MTTSDETPAQYKIRNSQSQMIHERRFLARQEEFNNERENHFKRGLARLIFEPGYCLRNAIYNPKQGSAFDIFEAVIAETGKTALYAHYVIQPLATKIGEMLA